MKTSSTSTVICLVESEAKVAYFDRTLYKLGHFRRRAGTFGSDISNFKEAASRIIEVLEEEKYE